MNANLFHGYDVIILTETWLNLHIDSAEIGLQNYDVYRDDRNVNLASRGGGVLIGINKKYKISRCKNLLDDIVSIDHVYVNVKVGNSSLIIGATYIPPLADICFYQDYVMCIEELKNFYSESKFILIGDYNIPSVDWKNNNYTFNEFTTNYVKNCCCILTESFKSLGLLQYNDIVNCSNNVLDLCFSDCKVKISKSLDHISKVDTFHPPLDIDLDFEVNVKFENYLKYDFSYYNFKKCDYTVINNEINKIDWDVLFNNLDSVTAVKVFYENILNIINKFVPKFKYTESKFPVWFTQELKSKVFKKKIAHKKYKSSKNKKKKFKNYKLFDKLRNECKELAKTCYENYLNKIQYNLRKDPQGFWRFVNSQKSNNSFPNLMHLKNNYADNFQDISNLFSNFFSTVYSSKDKYLNKNIDYDSIKNNIENFEKIKNLSTNYFDITLREIEIAINKLKPSFKPGPDGIPSVFIKNCYSSLLKPLFILFNLSIKFGNLHPLWKSAHINPIFKSGSPQDIENYRPVALISAIPKILDNIMSVKLKSLLPDIISAKQHGFMNNRSTLTNLAIYTNYIYSCFESKSQVDSIYLDFKKAFDLVDHEILIFKLKFYMVSQIFL